MSIQLPELPSPATYDPGRFGIMYSAAQLRAYALDAVRLNAPGWIAVSERLPDWPDGMGENQCLVFNPSTGIFLATQHPSWWNHDDERGPEYDGETVTHWQPLPPLPKGNP